MLATRSVAPFASCGGALAWEAPPAFYWIIGYDPVVHAMKTVGQARAPTFVDDLVALVRGPRHAARLQLLLLAVGHCAGLLTEGHVCASAVVGGQRADLQRYLEALPVRVETRPGGQLSLRPSLARGARSNAASASAA